MGAARSNNDAGNVVDRISINNRVDNANYGCPISQQLEMLKLQLAEKGQQNKHISNVNHMSEKA